MKVLLAGKYSVIEPLGLMFLEASLRELGVDVQLVLFGANSEMASDGADLIGFSTYTGYHKTVFRVSRYAKENFKVKSVIGGPHATFFSDDCLAYADYVVVGEGFESLKRICRGEVKNGKVFTPKLVSEDKIPLPYRKTLYQTYGEFHTNPIKNVMASFGCPFTCTYCYNSGYHRLYGAKVVRFREVDKVIEECKELKQYPLELIFFQDDCFGFKLAWLEEFVPKYRSKVRVPFHCQIRPEMATMDRLRLLKKAGCHGVTMALESANEKVRCNLLGRKVRDADILKACALVKNFGLKLRTEQMLGIPNTEFEDELKLVKLNSEIKPNIAWSSMYTPYLGTELGDYCKKVGLYSGNNNDLDDNFFSDSKLNFDSGRLAKTNQLQKVFSTCSQMVNGDKLAESFLNKNKYDFDNWFSAMRKHLYDEDLYKVKKI